MHPYAFITLVGLAAGLLILMITPQTIRTSVSHLWEHALFKAILAVTLTIPVFLLWPPGAFGNATPIEHAYWQQAETFVWLSDLFFPRRNFAVLLLFLVLGDWTLGNINALRSRTWTRQKFAATGIKMAVYIITCAGITGMSRVYTLISWAEYWWFFYLSVQEIDSIIDHMPKGSPIKKLWATLREKISRHSPHGTYLDPVERAQKEALIDIPEKGEKGERGDPGPRGKPGPRGRPGGLPSLTTRPEEGDGHVP